MFVGAFRSGPSGEHPQNIRMQSNVFVLQCISVLYALIEDIINMSQLHWCFATLCRLEDGDSFRIKSVRLVVGLLVAGIVVLLQQNCLQSRISFSSTCCCGFPPTICVVL